MQCWKCANTVDEDSHYCEFCGEKLMDLSHTTSQNISSDSGWRQPTQPIADRVAVEKPVLFINLLTNERKVMPIDDQGMWSGAITRMIGRQDWKWVCILLTIQACIIFIFSRVGFGGFAFAFLVGYGVNVWFTPRYNKIWIQELVGRGYTPATRHDLERCREMGAELPDETAENSGMLIKKNERQEDDVFSQIEKFVSLRDKGIISEEEFEKKKKELLNL